MTSSPAEHNVVLVGAGHAHLAALRLFSINREPRMRLTLVTRHELAPYSGMLPGVIAQHYTAAEAHIDTEPLCRLAGAELCIDEVIGLDLANRRVLCRHAAPITYDSLSLDIGSTAGLQDIAGVAAHTVPVKPIDQVLPRIDAERERILAANGRARIGVVGGGPGGIEVMLALQHRLAGDMAAAGLDCTGLAFVVITAGPDLLPELPVRARRRIARILKDRNIEVRLNSRVTEVMAGAVVVNGCEDINLDEIFWSTHAEAAPWLRETGLALDARGFVRVTESLQSVSHPDVFAVGDIAAFAGRDLPKSGVYALRSGPPLARNLRRLVQGRPLQPFRPQRHVLYLISTGDRYAVGTRNGLAFEGRWAWRLKDWLDRSFIDSFRSAAIDPARLPKPETNH